MNFLDDLLTIASHSYIVMSSFCKKSQKEVL